MSDAEIRRLLRDSWDDQRLSRGERKTLAELVRGAPGGARTTPQELRAVAFSLAKDIAEGDDHSAAALVRWLGDIMALTSADSPVVPTSGASEVWFAPHQDVCGRIMRAFGEAREHVDVCVFTITDDRITRAMMAAHRRGVTMRLVSDDMKSGDLGSDIGRLAALGVAVRIDRTPAHMHHKFALFDRETLLSGSYNWTRSAGEENAENLVVTRDAALIPAFAAEFERLWAASNAY